MKNNFKADHIKNECPKFDVVANASWTPSHSSSLLGYKTHHWMV